MKFLLFILLSSSASACDVQYSMADLQTLKRGVPPLVLKQCIGKSCVCVDDFPYGVNTIGMQFATLDDNSISVDPVKEAAEDARLEAIQEDKDLEAAEIADIKQKLKNGTSTMTDFKAALNILLKGK